MSLVEQLNDIYYKYETWHDEKLDLSHITEYHESRIRAGELITVSDGDTLVGYVEFRKTGGVCFVQNLFILPQYRLGRVIRMLKNRLFEMCKDCKIFLGERNKNKSRFQEVQLRRRNGHHQANYSI